jgi:hypothetical protein
MSESTTTPLAEFEDRWYVWQSLIGGQHHARRKGDGTIVMLHDNSPRELAEQIRAHEAKPHAGA